MRMSLITAPLELQNDRFFMRKFDLLSKFFIVLLGSFCYYSSTGTAWGRSGLNENHSQLEKIMTDYTKEMLSTMEEAAPLSLDVVNALIANNKAFATVSKQSIIAKAKSNGIEYIAKAPAAKRAKGATKTQLVDAIAKKTNAKLSGLEKATAQSLANLLDSLLSS